MLVLCETMHMLDCDWYVTLRESSGKTETDIHSVGAYFYRWRNEREPGFTILFGSASGTSSIRDVRLALAAGPA